MLSAISFSLVKSRILLIGKELNFKEMTEMEKILYISKSEPWAGKESFCPDLEENIVRKGENGPFPKMFSKTSVSFC